MSSFVLILLVVCLPETLRSIAGNGTLPLSGIHESLYRRFTKPPPPPTPYTQEEEEQSESNSPQGRKVTVMTFLEPLKMFKEKDIACTLIFGGVVYTVWSMAVASTTGIFKHRFGLDELKLGLVFLPNGESTRPAPPGPSPPARCIPPN